MSNEAINWALAQQGLRSSEKFVLLVLANRANAEWLCWPSLAALQSDTCLNRKTIIAALERLSEHGLIIDNEERKGRTNQIIVYRVGHGAPNSPEFSFDLWYERLVRKPVSAKKRSSSAPKEFRYSRQRVPETGHGTYTEPTKEPSAESIALASARKTRGGSSHKQLKKTPLTEDWVPSADDRSFAEVRGLDADVQAEAFKYHHIAKGSLMQTWSAAFRSWCLNATRLNPTGVRSTIVPRAATAEAADPSDPYGCRAWASMLPDTIPEIDDGSPVLSLGGFERRRGSSRLMPRRRLTDRLARRPESYSGMAPFRYRLRDYPGCGSISEAPTRAGTLAVPRRPRARTGSPRIASAFAGRRNAVARQQCSPPQTSAPRQSYGPIGQRGLLIARSTTPLPAVTVRLLPAGHLIQRITLRVISPTFCIATVRLNATNSQTSSGGGAPRLQIANTPRAFIRSGRSSGWR